MDEDMWLGWRVGSYVSAFSRYCLSLKPTHSSSDTLVNCAVFALPGQLREVRHCGMAIMAPRLIARACVLLADKRDLRRLATNRNFVAAYCSPRRRAPALLSLA